MTLDVVAVDAGFFLGAEGKGCDGVAGGLGEQRGPMGGAVNVVLLDCYGDLGEDVIGGAVGRQYEVCLVELVGLVGVDVAPCVSASSSRVARAAWLRWEENTVAATPSWRRRNRLASLATWDS